MVEEFFQQVLFKSESTKTSKGDAERESEIPVSQFMDRTSTNNIPKMQYTFIEYVVLPCAQVYTPLLHLLILFRHCVLLSRA